MNLIIQLFPGVTSICACARACVCVGGGVIEVFKALQTIWVLTQQLGTVVVSVKGDGVTAKAMFQKNVIHKLSQGLDLVHQLHFDQLHCNHSCVRSHFGKRGFASL